MSPTASSPSYDRKACWSGQRGDRPAGPAGDGQAEVGGRVPLAEVEHRPSRSGVDSTRPRRVSAAGTAAAAPRRSARRRARCTPRPGRRTRTGRLSPPMPASSAATASKCEDPPAVRMISSPPNSPSSRIARRPEIPQPGGYVVRPDRPPRSRPPRRAAARRRPRHRATALRLVGAPTPGPPAGAPRSTTTSTGRGARASPARMISTPVTESTKQISRNPSSRPSSAATHANPSGSTSSLASMIVDTPNARYSRMCPDRRRRDAHAPAASCRAMSCGASVVLPCGARETPRAAHQSAMRATLWATADASNTITRRREPGDRRTRGHHLGHRRAVEACRETLVTPVDPFAAECRQCRRVHE